MIRNRHKYRMDLVLWYFGLWILSKPNPDPNGYPIELETFKIPKKNLFQTWSQFLICIQNTLKHYWTFEIIIYYMKVDGWRWRLKLEIFRFLFCFHWVMFFISWELGFRFILSFIWFSFYQWQCLLFVWF